MQINTGAVIIPIERDGKKVGNISFNPNELGFAERYYSLLSNFEQRYQGYMDRIHKLEENEELDMFDVPKNMGDALKLTREFCEHMRAQVDMVFGEGSSQLIFGDAIVPDTFEQFFNGIAPYVQEARAGKVQKYTKTTKNKAVMK